MTTFSQKKGLYDSIPYLLTLGGNKNRTGMMHGHGLPLTKQVSRDTSNQLLHVRSGRVTGPIMIHYRKVNTVNEYQAAPSTTSIMGLPSNHNTSELILHGMSTGVKVLSWEMPECYDLLDHQELEQHRYLQVKVYTNCDKPDTAYLHLGASCSYPLEFTRSTRRLMELTKNSSRELHKFIFLHIQQNVRQIDSSFHFKSKEERRE